MTTRRNILFAVAATAGLAGTGNAAFTVVRPGTAFGTTVRLQVTSHTAAAANRALDRAFAEIRSVHRAASLFDAKSEVSILNQTKQLQNPSQTLRDIVAVSDHLNTLTEGAFDPSIQPLWQAWTRGSVSQHQIENALLHVGWRKVFEHGAGMRLAEGAALSFNGVAQGYAADTVLAAISEEGAIRASIDTGEFGALNSGGAILVQHPRQARPLGAIALQNGFAAVSGDYATRFTEDYEHHHIFDPKSGVSPRQLASVAVVAPSGAMADGLATAFMVMGTEASLRCLERLPGCAALFVGKQGEIVLSDAMRPLFQKT